MNQVSYFAVYYVYICAYLLCLDKDFSSCNGGNNELSPNGDRKLSLILFHLFFLSFFISCISRREVQNILFCLLLPVSQRALSTTTSSLSSFAGVISMRLCFCPTFQETLCFVNSCTDVAFYVNVRQKYNRNVNCAATANQNMAPHTCCESNGEKIHSRNLGTSLLGH